jgi:hypothetical protein
MVRTRAIVRSCKPLAGIAVVIALSEEPRLLLGVLSIPLALAVPLMVWSMKRVIDRVAAGQSIDRTGLVSYGFSLALTAAGVCFFFLLEAAGRLAVRSGTARRARI